MDYDAGFIPGKVHCRIGSSEIESVIRPGDDGVHCRIGSSEMHLGGAVAGLGVHCRIGSSETLGVGGRAIGDGSLPHRQLRNAVGPMLVTRSCSLPHRQLRNGRNGQGQPAARSLPHRQLRKWRPTPHEREPVFTAA